jgi:hypothetical protein
MTERQLYFSSSRYASISNWWSAGCPKPARSPGHGSPEVRILIRELCPAKRADQQHRAGKLMDEVMDETFGPGPLETLLKDPTITDIRSTA